MSSVADQIEAGWQYIRETYGPMLALGIMQRGDHPPVRFSGRRPALGADQAADTIRVEPIRRHRYQRGHFEHQVTRSRVGHALVQLHNPRRRIADQCRSHQLVSDDREQVRLLGRHDVGPSPDCGPAMTWPIGSNSSRLVQLVPR